MTIVCTSYDKPGPRHWPSPCCAHRRMRHSLPTLSPSRRAATASIIRPHPSFSRNTRMGYTPHGARFDCVRGFPRRGVWKDAATAVRVRTCWALVRVGALAGERNSPGSIIIIITMSSAMNHQHHIDKFHTKTNQIVESRDDLLERKKQITSSADDDHPTAPSPGPCDVCRVPHVVCM